MKFVVWKRLQPGPFNPGHSTPFFTGTDIADIFPQDDVPSNCSFESANTLEGLPFADNTFDYVFQRFMVTAFTPAQWDRAIAELVRVTKPGGYVELGKWFVEGDVVIFVNGLVLTDNKRLNSSFRSRGRANSTQRRPTLSAIRKCPRVSCINYPIILTSDTRIRSPSLPIHPTPVATAIKSRGVDTRLVEDLGALLTPHLQDVTADWASFPIGWHGRLGELHINSLRLGFDGFRSFLKPLMGCDDAEYDAVTEQIPLECMRHR
ncbi:hypothetical protein BC938DRAFT_476535 [Jimgerdemannia flammicorona]|uniref:Methyltransferase type 11 domain-containing protein n=1 Tax=Jimgerdemannia flammicorona TaxID=994334 RepID=A0A433QQF8_9FUNG|nr:hypothetical protein BC938DRAFT_476535 [Jimgerdemannia flammicorona]